MTEYRGIPTLIKSGGKRFYAIRYVVGWPGRDIIKVGSTFGKRRAYDYAFTGGEALLIDYYPSLGDALRAERALWSQLRHQHPRAFMDKEAAMEILPRSGWTECLSIPESEWVVSLWAR